MSARSTKKTNRQIDFHRAPVLNPQQLGGIETAVLDDGPGRGVRVAWVNTGGGLRYKVVLDRGLDIADADYRGYSLTWHSLTGIVGPNPAYCRGTQWLNGFYGGLLVSCGPLNTGAPSEDAGQAWPLHGTHSHTPAQQVTIVNPSPRDGRMQMSIAGLVRTARVFGPNLELRRSIRSELGSSAIELEDEFVNLGDQPVELAWLLHINFGYPLLEPEVSEFCYRGLVMPRTDSVEWFAEDKPFKRVSRPLPAHRGGGEVFAYIDPAADRRGQVLCGLVNKRLRIAVALTFNKADFPRLGNWQHYGPRGSFVAALEPMTAGVEGRHIDRQRGWLLRLRPGQRRSFRCRITATDDAAMLERLLALNEAPVQVGRIE